MVCYCPVSRSKQTLCGHSWLLEHPLHRCFCRRVYLENYCLQSKGLYTLLTHHFISIWWNDASRSSRGCVIMTWMWWREPPFSHSRFQAQGAYFMAQWHIGLSAFRFICILFCQMLCSKIGLVLALMLVYLFMWFSVAYSNILIRSRENMRYVIHLC